MLRCFECKEYEHFTRECPARRENRETEQIQQIFILDEDQTILQTPPMDAGDDIMMKTLTKARESLNL